MFASRLEEGIISRGWLQANMWLLELELRTSEGRGACALNHWDISRAPSVNFFTYALFQKSWDQLPIFLSEF